MRLVFLDLLLFLSLHVLSSSEYNGIPLEAPRVPWCGLTDIGHSCISLQGQPVTVPCGDHTDQQQLSFTYYQQSNHKILLTDSTSYLQWYPQWNETGEHVCCVPNATISYSEIPCYRMEVLYPPLEVPTKWPSGVNKWPVHGSPFQLNCPLQSNPPANYTWTRYLSIDRKRKAYFSSDVVFFDNGKRWHVETFTAAHEGVYECQATNALGEREYQNDGLFFLKPDACSRSSATNSSVIITTSKTTYRLGDSLSLTCTVHSAHTFGMIPHWSVERDSTKELCRPPLCSRQRPVRDESSCSWSTVLNVSNYQGEKFVCSYGEQSATANLEIEGSREYGHVVASIGGLSTCTLLAIIIAFIWTQRLSRYSYSQSKEPPMDDFNYDLFISAHDETRQLIEQIILHPLETQCQPSYKICWHLRDFIAGISIREQIAEAVHKSRKVLFVFSENFSESEFCRLELELAMKRFMVTNTRCVVPIAIDEAAVPNSLRQTLTYWPVVLANERNLLERMRQLIGEPIERRGHTQPPL